MRRILLTAALAAIVTTPAIAEQTLDGVSADTYELDKTHAFLTWTVTHNGISHYTANFTDFDATLEFDPDDLSASSIEVTINPTGIETNYPGDYKAGHPDSEYASWNEALSMGDNFMKAGEYPEITFVSTSAETTGDFTGTVTGDLTFLGVTKPVTMDVTYNGMANLPWYGPRDLVGFNASTTISRSEFGQTSLEGMISDDVKIEFSGEFLQAE
ncbi:YceI family protein [Henriciella litoralis]|uniref:YceI family protein n=1 Tax=Henriciella litoralis TaxID=568102 RepID=UPI000A06808B|nr:YceI family protein [Henriciella litoralis]